MKKIIDTIIDNWPISIALAACCLLAFFGLACEPKTGSLVDPAEKVTRGELLSELDYLIARANTRISDLDKQQELRNFVFQQSLTIANTGVINPLGIATSLLAVLGIGATVDDVRLRKQRKLQITYEPYVKTSG